MSITQLSELTQDPTNANKGTRRGRDMVATSLKKYGTGRSILIDKNGVIIAGNKTAEQAGKIGMTNLRVIETTGDELIAVQRTDLDLLTDPEAKELAIADNRAGELGLDWDPEAINSLALEGVNLEEFFNRDELAELLGPVDLLTDEDDAPALPQVAVTKPGDLYSLGSHRLLCGDATNVADYVRLMGSNDAACVWTDPPYNVDYTGKTADALKIEGDKRSALEFDTFLQRVFFALAGVMRKGAAIYVAHADTAGLAFRNAFTQAGFHLSGCLIWKKNTMVLGHSDYQWRHEPILYGWKPGAAHYYRGGRRQTTIQEFDQPRPTQMPDGSWQIALGDETFVIRGTDLTVEPLTGTVFTENKPPRSSEHPTMKPVALISRQLQNSTRPTEIVLDPFGGSGSTLIACERLGRNARLLEIDPRYCDVILDRWASATGQDPVREDGVKWSRKRSAA